VEWELKLRLRELLTNKPLFRKVILGLILFSLAIEPFPLVSLAQSEMVDAPRRVNVPYGPSDAPYPSHAVFWFGRVDPTHNYSDVRILFSEEWLMFTIHTIDRLLWIDETPSASDLSEWDSISIYLNTAGATGTAPSSTSYRFDVQLGDFYRIYRGNGAGWSLVSIPETIIYTGWRGLSGPNSNGDAKGWTADVAVPFSGLGFATTPPLGSTWGLGVIAYDRDDAAGALRVIKTWPEAMQSNSPQTWGEMSLGWKPVHYPEAFSKGLTVIQHGFENVSVTDGHVGGHTSCGYGLDHWGAWGNTNYSGYDQINVQNQWDISDWPCFSKFFITFPLASVPAQKTIISAKLTLTLFGNAGGGIFGEPPVSYIQVFTLQEDWNEATLTWNNAPLARENIAGVWVQPRDYSLPYETYSWEVREAVVEALQAGQPLRLAMYSADGEYHSGKYFWSSDSNEWGGVIRPKLEVLWGDDCGLPGVNCNLFYLPVANR
jgi:hypothetical protein